MTSAQAVLQQRVDERIDRQIRPFLRLHGGDCELLNVDDGVVRIRFLMACTACKLRPLTLLAGVRPRLMDVPGVVDVQAEGVGVSDRAVRRLEMAAGKPRAQQGAQPAREQRNQRCA